MMYIRTDMNEQIATGHVMRCLAIADALRTLGESVTFILADEQAVDLLKKHEYDAIVLHTPWNDMEKELTVINQLVEERHIDRLLIDSYQVTQEYLEELSKLVKTFYIDDLNLFDYPVHAVICYANYYKKFYHKLNNRETEHLLGTKYVPLRKSFWNCGSKSVLKEVENILILTGGSDPYNVSEQLLNAINVDEFKNIDVIGGVYQANYDTLVELYGQCKRIHFYQAINNIEQYMKKADIAISAGGTTLYELCACGTPTISYSFVDNQLDNVRQFQKDDLMDYAGDARFDDITRNITKFLENYRRDLVLREMRSEKMQKMVDGKGALRIAKIIMD